MQPTQFNKQFADQFRQETLTYPCFVEDQYMHMLFRQFAGRDGELNIIGNALFQRIDDVANIIALMVQLREKNIQDAFRLTCIGLEIRKLFSSYIKTEPYTAGYFQELLDTLQPFISLTGSLQEKMEHLFEKLGVLLFTEMNTCEKETLYQEMAEIMTEITTCSDDIRAYYDYFYNCFDRELENNRGVAQATYVEMYLLQLVSFIEAVFCSTEDLQWQSEKWSRHLYDLEMQEMYN